MAFLTRSILILLALYGLVFAVGDIYLVQHGGSLWIGVCFAILMVALQFLVSPWIIERILNIHWEYESGGVRSVDSSNPLSILDATGNLEKPDSSLLPAVNRQFIEDLCLRQGLKVPRLGVIDSNTPNAFCFGRLRSDARLVVTTGLIEVLTPEETNAVLAHEIGHIAHYDFLIMTIAALAPLLLYQIYIWTGKINQTKAVAQGAYLCYWISQWIVLTLNRTREYCADHYSAEVTKTPDALSSALVKIAYGMVRAEGEFRQAQAHGSPTDKSYHRKQRHMGATIALMGISNVRSGSSLAAGMANPAEAAAVMRWDLANPWARLYEMSSTHPLTALRVQALNRDAESLHQPVQYPLPQDQRTRWGIFPLEFLIWATPWCCAAIVVLSVLWRQLLGFLHLSLPLHYAPILLMIAGFSWLPRVVLRYYGSFREVNIGTLLQDLDVSQMRPRAVRLRGEIVGRGIPGAFWSADLVLRDATGMLFVLNRQSIPFARFFFAVDQADSFIGEEVEIEGWYRRGLRPYVELSRMTSATSVYRSHSRWIQVALSAVVVFIGWLWLFN